MTSKTERMIHGICSTERIVDRSRSSDGSDNQVLLARGAALVTPLPLLLEHSGDPVGKVVHLRRIGAQLYCRAVVYHDRVWQEIDSLRLRGLSLGVTQDHYQIRIKEEEGVVKVIDSFRIEEISLTSQPLNKDCFCRIYSGGFEGRVASQRTASEIRRINDRARAMIRLDGKYASKAENSNNSGEKWMSLAERRRFDAWFKKSLTNDER